MEKGFLDIIVERKDLKSTLTQLLELIMAKDKEEQA